jgi:hypothetical protein
MNGNSVSRTRHAGGQVIAVLAISAAALLAMVALVIDGGTAFAQQRVTQNAADAASEAGAVVLLQKLVGVTPAKTDTDVFNAVQTSGGSNGLTLPVAGCYTNLKGAPLMPDGSLATSCDTAAQIGGGVIPPCLDCAGSSAAGVHARGSRPFKTFFAGIVGLHDFTAAAEATAIAGYVNAISGPVVPVTFPVNATYCDGSNKPVDSNTAWPVTAGPPATLISIPLCNGEPGNVGWLDWTPTSGGASELADAIVPPPGNPAIITPHWYYVTATGNVNPGTVQTAMDFWNGKDINLPIFKTTCNATPANIVANQPGLESDCTAGGGTLGGGTGSNNW